MLNNRFFWVFFFVLLLFFSSCFSTFLSDFSFLSKFSFVSTFLRLLVTQNLYAHNTRISAKSDPRQVVGTLHRGQPFQLFIVSSPQVRRLGAPPNRSANAAKLYRSAINAKPGSICNNQVIRWTWHLVPKAWHLIPDTNASHLFKVTLSGTWGDTQKFPCLCRVNIVPQYGLNLDPTQLNYVKSVMAVMT